MIQDANIEREAVPLFRRHETTHADPALRTRLVDHYGLRLAVGTRSLIGPVDATTPSQTGYAHED